MEYEQKEVYDATLEYFDGDTLATDVFFKYPLVNSLGKYLEKTPDDLHERLAREFARIEGKYENPMLFDEIRDLLDKFKMIIPQGSPMSGIGNPYQIQSLSNCFVIDQPHDSYGGILFADQEQVQIMKRRGGVGQDLSLLRPRGLPTLNAAKTTDGIGVFMERFSNSTGEVAQGGRRGALMMTIDCRHPEIETFIGIKLDRSKVTSANISVRWTDDFMNAVENKEEFILRWPVDSSIEEAQYTKTINAHEVWSKFIDAAHDCAEPGALFWDTIIDRSPADCYVDVGYKTISTNPCVTGDTMVATNVGPKTIKDLAENNVQFNAVSYDIGENKKVIKLATAFKTKESAKILEIKTKSGKSIKLTPDHRVYTQRGWIEAGALQKTDKILKLK